MKARRIHKAQGGTTSNAEPTEALEYVKSTLVPLNGKAIASCYNIYHDSKYDLGTFVDNLFDGCASSIITINTQINDLTSNIVDLRENVAYLDLCDDYGIDIECDVPITVRNICTGLLETLDPNIVGSRMIYPFYRLIDVQYNVTKLILHSGTYCEDFWQLTSTTTWDDDATTRRGDNASNMLMSIKYLDISGLNNLALNSENKTDWMFMQTPTTLTYLDCSNYTLAANIFQSTGLQTVIMDSVSDTGTIPTVYTNYFPSTITKFSARNVNFGSKAIPVMLPTAATNTCDMDFTGSTFYTPLFNSTSNTNSGMLVKTVDIKNCTFGNSSYVAGLINNCCGEIKNIDTITIAYREGGVPFLNKYNGPDLDWTISNKLINRMSGNNPDFTPCSLADGCTSKINIKLNTTDSVLYRFTDCYSVDLNGTAIDEANFASVLFFYGVKSMKMTGIELLTCSNEDAELILGYNNSFAVTALDSNTWKYNSTSHKIKTLTVYGDYFTSIDLTLFTLMTTLNLERVSDTTDILTTITWCSTTGSSVGGDNINIYMTKLTEDCIVALFNNVSSRTISINETVYNKLTTADIAIATGKSCTVTKIA